MSKITVSEPLLDSLQRELGKFNQVKVLSEYILSELKITTPEKAISSSEIFNHYKKLREISNQIPEIPEGTYSVYLSKNATSPDSTINCEGRKQGYYIDQLVERLAEINKIELKTEEKETETLKEQRETTLKEKEIYPLLREWLFANDYSNVADISNERGQGKWGNPDLIGLKVEELFGRIEVEITTVEVKLTNDNWKQWIFEAVAHTVFANRSYFAFIYPDTLTNKIDPELRDYAEIFKIGIVVIIVSGDDYLKIKNRQKFSLSKDNHRIFELSPAPYNETQVKYKKKFLSSLGISQPIELIKFGDTLVK